MIRCSLSRQALCVALCAALLLLGGTRAWAADAAELYGQAQGAYDAISRNQDQARNPALWAKVESRFLQAQQADPTGPLVPNCLFYLGRIAEERGGLTGSIQDFADASANYKVLAERYPDNQLTSVAQYRRALLYAERLNQPEDATAILQQLIDKDPRSELGMRSRELLAKVQGGSAAVPTVATSSRSSGTSASSSAASSGSSDMPRPAPVAPLPSGEGLKVREMNPDEGGSPSVMQPSAPAAPPAQAAPAPQSDAGPPAAVAKPAPKAEADVKPEAPPKAKPEVTPEAKAKVQAEAADKPEAKAPPKSGGRKDIAEQLGLTIDTIVIDPGHGGKDPGAMANGLREKDLTLAIAKRVGKMLQAKGFKVYFTRSTDVFIPLEERTSFANDKKADLFVSIHINASPNSAGNGLETYSLNVAKTKQAQRVAARENGVSVAQISDLQVILTDLMLGAKVRESSDLAGNVQKSVCNTVARSCDIGDHGTHEAPFYVLVGAKMPAILVECGYITNPTEARRLGSDSYQQLLAEGIVGGISGYKQRLERLAVAGK